MSKMWQGGILKQVLTEQAISNNIQREPVEMPDVGPDASRGKADALVSHKSPEEP